MSDIEKKLFEIVAKQQKIITALVKQAQAVPAHRDEVTHGLTDKQVNPSQDHAPPAQSISTPNAPRLKDADAILRFLPPLVRAAVKTIQVQPSRDPQFDAIVKVLFNPGKDSNAAFVAIQNAVKSLQQSNVLQGKNYSIQSVA
jgi:hypothetical protein